MKSISIIVPVYYGEVYMDGIIRQAEACKQCMEKEDIVEVLFINDAPNAPLSQKRKSELVDISIVNTDENVGIHGARVKGLKRSQGDYILFLDQDDVVKPNYVRSQLQVIGKNDAAVCNAVYGEKLLYAEYPVFENILCKRKMLTGWNPIASPGQVLLKRRAIPDIWIQNILKHNGADDWFLWLCMTSENCSFALNNEVLYEHILNGKNTSEDVVSMLQSEQEVMNILQERKIFSDEDFKALMDGFFMMNLRRTKKLFSDKKKLMLLEKWIMSEGIEPGYSEYLFRSGLQSVAIYGCGVLGEYLYARLKDHLHVKYFIDKNAKELRREIPVYSLQDTLPEVDGVVITLLGGIDEVIGELRDKRFSAIFVLKDWLEEK